MKRSPIRRLFRFSLAGLLFAMSCVAGYFSGYDLGRDKSTRQLYLETEVSVVYQIGDFISDVGQPEHTLSAVEELVEFISTTVFHEVWQQNGGYFSIEALPNKEHPNCSGPILCISANGLVHEEIEALLESLRSIAGNVATEEVIPQLQSVVALQDPEHYQIIRAYKKYGEFSEKRIPRQFDSAVKEVCRLWGAPDFRGECTDPNFPSWSSASEIAIWPKNGGFAFVEIRDMSVEVNDQKSVYSGIATGWRPNEENSKLIVEYRWVGPSPK